MNIFRRLGILILLLVCLPSTLTTATPLDESSLTLWQTFEVIQLAWQPHPDATGYHIYRRIGDQEWVLLTPTPISTHHFVENAPVSHSPTPLSYRVTRLLSDGTEHNHTPPATLIYIPPPPMPQSVSTFNVNDLLSDEEFLDAQSVSATQIQAYFEQLQSILATYRLPDRRLISTAIVEIATEHGINPLLLLSRLQVEQGLVSETKPPAQQRLDYALGFGCSDGAECNPAFRGIDRQLAAAALNLRAYVDEIDRNGVTRSGWGPGILKQTLDGVWVRPANRATAALYTYTPHAGQQAGGTIPSGGNYLVWTMFYRYAAALGAPTRPPPTPTPPDELPLWEPVLTASAQPTINRATQFTTTFDLPPSFLTWDFGDGSPVRLTTAPTVTYTYTRAGTYLVSVTITREVSDDESEVSPPAVAQTIITVGHAIAQERWQIFLPWMLRP